MPNENKTVYIFDADGVVIEPWGFANVLESEYSITRQTTIPFFSTAFQKCLIGTSELQKTLEPYLSQWGWERSSSELIRIWHEAENLPRKSALDFVEKLRAAGHICCLASNQEKLRASYIREEMGFAELFDRLYFSCDLGAVKPDSQFFNAVTNDLGCLPEDVVFWDDSPNIVEGALAVGWKAHVYIDETSLELAVDAW